ncbi:hypothetical protein BMT54_10000 [Pasteurellaceae bacterium 15-036681]|nr:hypothetical protein BMT54_10000 [Pasteurellaceae bacterium 15-036681]
MTGWTMPIQQAMYRGVKFDVIDVSDSFERAIVEHAYPFKNGADLEDMGLAPHTVQMQAVFFGDGYYTDLKKFLNAIQKQGADVLVHPILGRMPNMLLASANLRHEAEFVDYVSLDLTFKEASEMQPIFVFESALVSQIDQLINQLEDLLNGSDDYWNSIMTTVSAVYNWKARLLGIWGGLYGSFDAIRELFGLDKKKYAISSAVSQQHYVTQGNAALWQLQEMITQGVDSASERYAMTFAAKLRNVVEVVENVKAVPNKVANDEGMNRSKTVKVRNEDVAQLSIMVDLIAFAKLTEFAVLLIEDEQDTLISYELEALNREVRLNALNLVNKLREVQRVDQLGNSQNKTTSVYQASESLIEMVREVTHGFTQLVISAINRKPPLMIRTSELNGTIHQIAHSFYGDYTRADELLRLNPHIREPNFITQGELLNAYSE